MAIIKFPIINPQVIVGKIPGSSFEKGTQLVVPEGYYIFTVQNGVSNWASIYRAGTYTFGPKDFPKCKAKGLFKKTYEMDVYFLNQNTDNHKINGNVVDREVKDRSGKMIKYSLHAKTDLGGFDTTKLAKTIKRYSLKPNKNGVVVGQPDLIDVFLLFLDDAIESVYNLKLADTFRGTTTWNVSPKSSRSAEEQKALNAVAKVVADKLSEFGASNVPKIELDCKA